MGRGRTQRMISLLAVGLGLIVVTGCAGGARLETGGFAQRGRGGHGMRGRRGRMRRADRAPALGAAAPNFKLTSVEGDRSVELASFKGDRPVILIFGSYTCPPFRRQVGALNNLYRTYGDVAEFFVVYIREAHAADSDWPEPVAEEENIMQPTTYDQRRSVAGRCVAKLNMDIPCLIDNMSNSVDKAYDGHPDRLFLVDIDGKIVIRGDRGPWGFKPAVVAAKKWLADRFPDVTSSIGTR